MSPTTPRPARSPSGRRPAPPLPAAAPPAAGPALGLRVGGHRRHRRPGRVRPADLRRPDLLHPVGVDDPDAPDRATASSSTSSATTSTRCTGATSSCSGGRPNEDCAGPPVPDLVKRVIGLPGETISDRNGTVYIDGKALDQSMAAQDTTNTTFTATFAPVKIAANDYFVMGDNRIDSCDSRDWGTVPGSYIVGQGRAAHLADHPDRHPLGASKGLPPGGPPRPGSRLRSPCSLSTPRSCSSSSSWP